MKVRFSTEAARKKGERRGRLAKYQWLVYMQVHVHASLVHLSIKRQNEWFLREGRSEFILPLIRSFQKDFNLESLFDRWGKLPYTVRLQGGWDIGDTGRFTYLCVDPYQVLTAKGRSVTWIDSKGLRRTKDVDPFQELAELYRPLQKRPFRKDVPFAFQGGAAGYLGYGLRTFVENVPANAGDDLAFPDMVFACYDVVLVYDHLTGEGHLISTGLPFEGEQARSHAKARLEQFLRAIEKGAGSESSVRQHVGSWKTQAVDRLAYELMAEGRSAFSKEEYVKAIEAAKGYIEKGDVLQVNIAQRFALPLTGDASDLFQTLSITNPSPFGAYIRGPDWAVVSVSPERYFFTDGSRVETRPIKGTRPRGKTQDEDQRLRQELVASEKDKSEHVMIVDLERNDLGQFCRYGSVDVPHLMRVEAHPTVWHLVSVVEGELRSDADLIDCVRATFPGGSITGAPKVRAMEIIDELEPVARGVYTGSIGYLGVGGRIDLNIAIRTVAVQGDFAYLHVGGGIVADSDPYDEYQETLDKGLGIARALAVQSLSPGKSPP